MAVLKQRKVISLADFFRLYQTYLHSTLDQKKAYSELAKLKTSIVRYLLPEYGVPLILDRHLTPAETTEGLVFMEQVPIYQAPHFLEVQDRVFVRFGDRISDSVRRNYRCALKKMLDWGATQEWWQFSLSPSEQRKTPAMLITKKRVEHTNRLKPHEITPALSAELDQLFTYLTSARPPHCKCFVESTCTRYGREILDILGWMYHVKMIPLSEMSLDQLVPLKAVYDKDAADRAAELAREYIEWTQANIGSSAGSLKFPLQSFLYIAEYRFYEYNYIGQTR